MKYLKEYEYINAPENNMELWIVEKNNPEMFVGYVNSLSKEVAMHLNIFLQKAGFKCVHSKPEYCEYARGIPAKYLLGDKTYIEWSSNESITEAVQTVKDNLKLKTTKVNKNPLKTVKAKQFFESRAKTTKKYGNIVEALRAAIASFQAIGVQVQLIEEFLGNKTLDVSYGPYHVFFDTLDDGLYDGYGKYLLTLPLANEPSVQWIGGNENELFADLKDVFNVLDKIMAEPNENGRNFAD